MSTQRWEYHIIITSLPLDADPLTKAGREGWDLVNAIPLTNGEVQLVFKRPEPSLQDQITADQRAAVLEEPA